MKNFLMSSTAIGMKLPLFDAEDEGGSAAAAGAETQAKTEVKTEAKAEAKTEAKTETKAAEGDAEKAELLREVMDKKTKLKDADKKVADATAKLAEYDGIDPATAKELLRKQKEAEQTAAEAKGDFERVKAMMAEEHDKALKKVNEDLEAERAERKKDRALIDDLTVGNSFASSTFIREDLVLSANKTRQLFGSHFEMKDGVLVAYDKPAGAANRTLLVTASGDPMSFDAAIERIIDADPDKATMRRSKVKTGAGSKTSEGGDASRKADNAAKEDTSGLYGVSRIAAAIAKDLVDTKS